MPSVNIFSLKILFRVAFLLYLECTLECVCLIVSAMICHNETVQ